MPIISAVGNRRPQSTTTIRPSYSTTVMFLPISPTPPSGRTRSVRAHAAVTPASRPWRASTSWIARALGLVALHQRQAQRPGVMAEHLQRGLDGRGARGDEHRRVDLLQRRVDLRARIRLVVASGASRCPTTCEATQMPPAPPMSRQRRVDVVVAGQDGEAVDQLQLVGVGLLDGLDAVDLGQLGQQVGRHVDRRAAGDVVEHHRRVARGLGDLAEVARRCRAGSACCSTA